MPSHAEQNTAGRLGGLQETHGDFGPPTKPHEGDDADSILRRCGIGELSPDPASPILGAALRHVVQELQSADELTRMLVRNQLVDRLTELGVRSAAKVVNAALGGLARSNDVTAQGRTLLLNDPEPWTEEVDGAALLEQICHVVRRYVDLSEQAVVAVALWIVHSHAFEAVTISPFLALVSPLKRCGKTTLVDVVGALVPRGLPAANISVAALFRTVESHRPTLLIDEADTFLARNEELRGMLNAGHTITTALVIRTVGDDHEPRAFSTWCPKVVASIGQLPETIEDRSIVIPMQRRMKGDKAARLRLDRLDAEMESFRRQAARWAADHVDELRGADPTVPDALHDRAQDNWRFLLAIADAAGGEWPDLARRAATWLSGSAWESDTSTPTQLLVDLRSLFESEGVDALASQAIVNRLIHLDDRPWSELGHGKPLTTNQLARLLRPFGVRPRTIRQASTTYKGYRRADLDDVFRRYLSSEPSQPEQAGNGNAPGDLLNRNSRPPVTDGNRGERHRNDKLVTAVTVDKVRGADAAWAIRDGSAEHAIQPRKACYACKGTDFWIRFDGDPVCARCHPPASEELVEGWLEA